MNTNPERYISCNEALTIFTGWRDSSALLLCRFRERPASFAMRGRVMEISDDRVRLLGENAELLFDVVDVFTSIEYLEPCGPAAGEAFASCLIFRVNVDTGESISDVVFEELIEPS